MKVWQVMIAACEKHTEVGRAGVWRGRSGGTAGLARSLLALLAIFSVCVFVSSCDAGPMLHKTSWLRRLYRCNCIGEIGDRSGWSGGMAVLACSLHVLPVCLCGVEAFSVICFASGAVVASTTRFAVRKYCRALENSAERYPTNSA